MSRNESATKAGALLAAIGVSACCWLPLLLVGLGAGAGGVGAFFEPLRPYLMVVTVAMLGSAFYLTYRRRTACASDGSCATGGASRRARITLWAVAALAGASFAFPYWSARRLADANAEASAAAGPPAFVFPVPGITCAACGVRIHDAVRALPGVATVKVEEDPGRVRVWTDGALDPACVATAIRAAGFEPGAPAVEESSTAADTLGSTGRRLRAAERTAAPERAVAGEGKERSPQVEELLARARREGKAVVLEFSGESCPACRELEEQTIADPRVQAALREVIYRRILAKEDPLAAAQFRIRTVPQLRFLRADGEIVAKASGVISVEKMLEHLSTLAGEK